MDAVVATGITKAFGSTVACDAVDLAVRSGSVHALLGENGAGKSTFVKMLFGLVQPDAGRLELWGGPARFRTPAEALASGVGMVQQHFSLAPNLTAEENLALAGRLLQRVDRDAVREAAERVAGSAGLDVRFGVPVGELGVGEQQRIEIVRALLTGARLLVLDEPTAVLSESEATSLLRSVRRLAAGGTTVLLITHRMVDVFEASDHVTVLRAGRVAVDAPTAELGRSDLVHAITGDRLTPYVRRELPACDGRPEILRIEQLVVHDGRGAVAVDGLSLVLRSGEIVGMAGVEGNGQRPLCEAVVGLREPTAGAVELDGRALAGVSPRRRFRAGLAYVPEDRHEEGLMLPLSTAVNFAPGVLRSPGVVRGRAVVAWRRVVDAYAAVAARFAIRPDRPDAVVGTLSGGNQQKVVVARALAPEPRCVIASQPSRGVDLSAAEDLRSELVEAARGGAAVLVISADLEELFAVSQRIVVLARGRIAWEGPALPQHRADIVAAMTGGGPVAADPLFAERAIA